MNTPISQATARSANSLLELSENARIVSLICLLGVTLSAAILPHVPADQLGWVIAHLE